MNDWQNKVREFHKIIDQLVSPAEPMLRNPVLRAALIAEEAIETVMALVGSSLGQTIVHNQLSAVLLKMTQDKRSGEPDLFEVLDGLCDTVVVCLGTAETIGVDLEPFYNEVMAANMRKRDPGGLQKMSTAPLGKVLKPEGWVGPDIKGVLAKMIGDA